MIATLKILWVSPFAGSNPAPCTTFKYFNCKVRGMPRPTGPTNPILRNLINEIRSKGYKEKSNFLIDLAERLGKPRRRKPEVNLSKLERYCNDKEIVIVPGKVLDGILTKPLKVAAISFSATAKQKIIRAGGETLSIKQLIEHNPNGKGVRIIC